MVHTYVNVTKAVRVWDTQVCRCHLSVDWLVLIVSMSNLNVPIGCQRRGRGSRRDYAGKTLREVVKFPYENGDIAQV